MGIGSRFMKELIGLSKNNNIGRIIVEVVVKNETTIAFKPSARL